MKRQSLAKNEIKDEKTAHANIPPQLGQTGHYICRSCGERFTGNILLFDFLDFLKCCPKCGSSRVVKDPTVVH
jgi:DNA-directed RNA polymerase subunit RPC12/RpoP